MHVHTYYYYTLLLRAGASRPPPAAPQVDSNTVSCGGRHAGHFRWDCRRWSQLTSQQRRQRISAGRGGGGATKPRRAALRPPRNQAGADCASTRACVRGRKMPHGARARTTTMMNTLGMPCMTPCMTPCTEPDTKRPWGAAHQTPGTVWHCTYGTCGVLHVCAVHWDEMALNSPLHGVNGLHHHERTKEGFGKGCQLGREVEKRDEGEAAGSWRWQRKRGRLCGRHSCAHCPPKRPGLLPRR